MSITREYLLEISLNVLSSEERKCITYPWVTQYTKSWDAVKGLTEPIQNMIDSKKPGTIEYRNGIAIIPDYGKGLTLDDFLVGQSRKTEDDIGQFGEGLKMAMLKWLELNRLMVIETVGMTLVPCLKYMDGFENRIMHLYYIPNDRKVGTTVYMECEEAELEAAKSYFLALQDREHIYKEVYEGQGEIFIAGFKVTHRIARHAYNFTGNRAKAIVNRDRTVLDEANMKSFIQSIIANTHNERYIEELLINPEDYDVYSIERQLGFNYSGSNAPKLRHPEVWAKVVKRLFPKYCVSSTLTNDLVATKIGYTIIEKHKTPFASIFDQFLPDSWTVIKEYGESEILGCDTIHFPIGANYMTHKTAVDAGVEFVKNAFDTNTEVTFEFDKKSKRIIIEDKGPGLKREHLVYGNNRNDPNALSNFGDGLKSAIHILTRLGLDLLIESTRFNIKARFESSPTFGGEIQILAMELLPPTRMEGTKISFNSDMATYKEIKQRLKHLFSDKKAIEQDVWRETGVKKQGLYLQGVLIEHIDSLFSYNTNDKSLFEGYRDYIVSYSTIKSIIADKLGKLTDEKLIERYLRFSKSNLHLLEYNVDFKIENPDVWRKVAEKMYKNPCLPSSHPQTNTFAEDEGFKVIMNVPQLQVPSLSILFPLADKVAYESHTKVTEIVPYSELSSEEKTLWNKAKRFMTWFYDFDVDRDLLIARDFKQASDKKAGGIYDYKDEKAYIHVDLLSDPEKLFGVLIHEIAIHGIHRHRDLTREFETALTYEAGRFAFLVAENLYRY